MKLLASFGLLLLINTTLCVYTEESCPKKEYTTKGQDFGLPWMTNDILTSMMGLWVLQDYFKSWRHLDSLGRDMSSKMKIEKDKFQINLDVHQFDPEEILVKTADGYVVIKAKHGEKKDAQGIVSRQFVRKYILPEGVETEDVVSELSNDGLLTITAPRKVVNAKGVRIVPITQTGPARMNFKEYAKKCKEKCGL